MKSFAGIPLALALSFSAALAFAAGKYVRLSAEVKAEGVSDWAGHGERSGFGAANPGARHGPSGLRSGRKPLLFDAVDS